jgi:predicted HicB family RNase H-like nuclease
MIPKKKRTQMAFDIQPEIHQKVKMLAVTRNISMNLWVHRAIVREIDRQLRSEHQENMAIQKYCNKGD